MNKEDLKNYKYSHKWIKEQLEKYEEQVTMVYNISQSLDGMPKAQNKPNYAIEELMDSYAELINILKNEQKKLNNIIKQLNELNPLHKTILTERYINGKTLEEIAANIGYSYHRTCRINGDALNEFDKVGKKWQDMAKNI